MRLRRSFYRGNIPARVLRGIVRCRGSQREHGDIFAAIGETSVEKAEGRPSVSRIQYRPPSVLGSASVFIQDCRPMVERVLRADSNELGVRGENRAVRALGSGSSQSIGRSGELCSRSCCRTDPMPSRRKCRCERCFRLTRRWSGTLTSFAPLSVGR